MYWHHRDLPQDIGNCYLGIVGHGYSLNGYMRTKLWSEVVFTDESCFYLWSPDGREELWRSQKVQFWVHHLWTGIFQRRFCFDVDRNSHWRTCRLHIWENCALNFHRYVEDILQETVFPYSHFNGDVFSLMHDNVRLHVAVIVTDDFDEVGILRLYWPTCSSNPNPIEQLWNEV